MPTDSRKLPTDVIVVDMHCDTVLPMQRGYDISERHGQYHVDIPRLRDGGVDLVVFATTVNSHDRSVSPFQQINRQIDVLTRAIEDNSANLKLCLTSDDALRARESGKIGVVFAVEGGHALEGDIANLQRLYDRGIRLLTIVHEQPTGCCVGWNERTPGIPGLTSLGREIIAEMNALGMMVDLSHSSPTTVDAVCELTRHPVVASHSCAYALCNHGRNIADAQAKAIAATGGVIGTAFVSIFLSADFERLTNEFWSWHVEAEKVLMRLFLSTMDESEKTTEYERYRLLLDEYELYVAAARPTVADVADHIDYMAELIGANYVAIGSDFDGMTLPPLGLEDCAGMPNLTTELVERGYLSDDLKKVLGLNFLRVFKEVCG